MYVLEHLKELDRSTGRRYVFLCFAGQCTSGVAGCCLHEDAFFLAAIPN
jgi:hypothetical protein